jgi:glycerol-3-phosphate acyltransferase PlsY
MTTPPLLLFLGLTAAAAYLLGAVPFGYLVGRARGVDVTKLGSRNVGATNVGRVLGAKWGVLVFALDFAKGALPVAAARRLLPQPEALPPETLAVLAGVAAFLGHLFPVYSASRAARASPPAPASSPSWCRG